jgi:hypothetical protein
MRPRIAQWPLHRVRCRQAVLGIALCANLLSWWLMTGCAITGPSHQTESAAVEADGQIRLSWDAPTTRADGSPLTDIAGFRLYYGPTSGTYAFMKTIGKQTTYALAGLEPGQTYYVAVGAYDSAGHESRPSEEVEITAPPTGGPPLMLTLDPLRRGQSSQFRVRGANPNEAVSFLFSTSGEGEGPCSPQLGGLCVDLVNPWVFGEATADGFGTATLDRTVPTDFAPGQAIVIQAVVRRGPNGTASVKTNTITARVMDR